VTRPDSAVGAPLPGLHRRASIKAARFNPLQSRGARERRRLLGQSLRARSDPRSAGNQGRFWPVPAMSVVAAGATAAYSPATIHLRSIDRRGMSRIWGIAPPNTAKRWAALSRTNPSSAVESRPVSFIAGSANSRARAQRTSSTLTVIFIRPPVVQKALSAQLGRNARPVLAELCPRTSARQRQKGLHEGPRTATSDHSRKTTGGALHNQGLAPA
jgi:hypothetical protein